MLTKRLEPFTVGDHVRLTVAERCHTAVKYRDRIGVVEGFSPEFTDFRGNIVRAVKVRWPGNKTLAELHPSSLERIAVDSPENASDNHEGDS